MTRDNTWLKRNIAGLMTLFLLSMLVLMGRVAWIQFVDGKNLAVRSQRILADYQQYQSHRGTIFDRNGRQLAVSVMAKTVFASPDEIPKNQDLQWLAQQIGELLNIPPDRIKKKLTAGGAFVYLKRTVDEQAAKKLQEFITKYKVLGIHFMEESKRYYPNDELAAHVLGFVGTDDVGLNGIETTLDKYIKGKPIRQKLFNEIHGMQNIDTLFRFPHSVQNNNVYLTIDSTIQYIAEKALAKAMVSTKAKSGNIIIMNPKTGEILAIACRPSYNPNNFAKYKEETWKNSVVSDLYEPGSTFKTIVAAAALQEKVVTPQEKFLDKGYIIVSGRRIQNWDKAGAGTITFEEAVKQSINTSFVEIGLKLGAERLNRYARAFGFGKKTDIELPGEAEGILFESNKMRDSDVATMAIGQSIAATPLQLLVAVSAIANDGVLLKPIIVKKIIDGQTNVETVQLPQVVRQAISKETADVLKGLLEKVILAGGGRKAKVPEYRFAGKTGTAEKLNETGTGYKPGEYIASFVGFGPVEDPQYAALIVLDSPQGAYYGGEVAAPVFSEIMTQIVRYGNISPQNNTYIVKPRDYEGNSSSKSNETVPINIPKRADGKVIVPSVIGKTMREVATILAQHDLSLQPEGSGIAQKQSVTAGVAVNAGTKVVVYFVPY